MSKETSMISRAFYQIILKSKNIEEAKKMARGIMDNEDVAVVEKMINEEEQ